MRIGIYFTSTKLHGGVYQYSVAFLEALSRINKNNYVIVSTSKDLPEKFYKRKNFKIINIFVGRHPFSLKLHNLLSSAATVFFYILIDIFYKLRLSDWITPIYKLSQQNIINIFEEENLDLIFYPTSFNLSFLVNIPSVVAFHDLQHKLNPQFKEVSARGIWENREYGYTNVSKNAFRIFVDSEIGKEDVESCYGTDLEKIVVLPYLCPSYLNTKISLRKVDHIINSLRLPKKYIFYPAKFWPHKNHKNLMKAIGLLKKEGRLVNLVLTGSKDADFSTFNEVFSLIKRLGIEKQIYYLGYVESEELSAIYKRSTALVMPTYFGPTNIPILEAWAMGTPVITSDIRGCRDQLGNAGLLVNPNKPRDIARKVWKIYTNEDLRLNLSGKGKKKVKKWSLNDFTLVIKKVIEDFKSERNYD